MQRKQSKRTARTPIFLSAMFVLVGGASIWGIFSATRHKPRQATGHEAAEVASVDEATHPTKPRSVYQQQLPMFVAKPETTESSNTRPAIDKKETSEWLVGTILKNLQASLSYGKGLPEEAANGSRDYIRGIAQTIRAVGPDLMNSMGAAMKQQVCAEGSHPEEMIAVAYLQQELPETATSEAFDCFFAKNGKEDIVTWSMLDAWQSSGMDLSAEMAARKAGWKDERTLSRLVPLETRQALTAKSLAEGDAIQRQRAGTLVQSSQSN